MLTVMEKRRFNRSGKSSAKIARDVYKRQVETMPTMLLREIASMAEPNDWPTVVAVSYTHLDVYKRQASSSYAILYGYCRRPGRQAEQL